MDMRQIRLTRALNINLGYKACDIRYPLLLSPERRLLPISLRRCSKHTRYETFPKIFPRLRYSEPIFDDLPDGYASLYPLPPEVLSRVGYGFEFNG
ncbi:hypothetical protein CISG_09020 [Coccidioides immitis RMSCC 3703]|uniref:Uncharacterized protein n=1 Tax=Coccidioides immitis RMSCC 3703 TaxID=454286 RepID=A0A0J8R8U1_COCIT|nr:hypothetical protein CISG_09020 [Coccidioides immitis RMSCC 3703]